MAVYSMTGFAHGQGTPGAASGTGSGGAGATATTGNTSASSATSAPGPRLSVEIRSVNSRFLDLSFRLPEELRQCEPALRDLLSGALKRGKVELRANIERAEADSLNAPSAALLQRLNSLQDQVQTWLPQARSLSVADVLKLGSGGSAAAGADHQAELLKIAKKTLKDFSAAREREGAKLCTMLRERIASLRQLAAQAEPLVPQVVAQQKQRFLERFSEALKLGSASADAAAEKSSIELAQQRALAEATAYAIRLDVAEEVSRLRAHLDEIERLLEKGGDIGKRLDFLIQELHREANTLGSKAGALELTQVSVEMKVLIEQMREQVQNIE
jgi:uncharacterized protein (TIGR00255 family)